MKVKVAFIEKKEEEHVLFTIHQHTPTIEQAIQLLKEEHFLIGEIEKQIHKLPFSSILYIEVVDKKSFIYTKRDVYQTNDRLYQLEEKVKDTQFIRTSKSMLLNIDQIVAISPLLSGRFEATLNNQERVEISRKYVPSLKKRLGMLK